MTRRLIPLPPPPLFFETWADNENLSTVCKPADVNYDETMKIEDVFWKLMKEGKGRIYSKGLTGNSDEVYLE